MASALRRINFMKIICKSAQQTVNTRTGLGSFRYLHLTDIQNDLKAKWRAPTLRQMKKRVDYLKEKGTYPVFRRSQFLDWNYDAELYAFGKRFNENFDDALLREALTESSYIFQETQRLKDLGVENPTLQMRSNRALADAGKALIEDFSTKYLRAVCPLVPEEGIQSFVDYLISDEVLGKIGQQLGFKDLILAQEYPPSEETFARCFSAVVGCLNNSSGLERCQHFILDFVITQMIGKDMWDIWKLDDPLHLLKSILLRSGRGTPEPRLMGDLGPKTIESVFHVGIYDGNKQLVGKGYGETTDIAIQMATFDSLSKLFDQTSSRAPMPFEDVDLSRISKTNPNPCVSDWKINYIEENSLS